MIKIEIMMNADRALDLINIREMENKDDMGVSPLYLYLHQA